MSSGIYCYLAQKLLNQLFGGTAYTFPTTLYAGLFSAAPTDTTTGTEATGGGYGREAVVCNTTNWPAISGTTNTITLGAAITFPTGTGSGYSGGSDMTDAGFFDSSSGGNLLCWGDLSTAKPILAGDTPSFAASALTVQLA